MKLAESTKEIFNSFSSINPSLIVPEGRVIRTMDPNQTMIARAELADNFETQLALYDLPNFLQVIKMFNDADIELHNDFAHIKYGDMTGDSGVKFVFAHPSVINSPVNDVQFPAHQIQFDLSATALSGLCTAASTMALHHLVITREDDTHILVNVTNNDNSTSNEFKTVLPATIDPDLGEFAIVIHFERLTKLIEKDYTVRISNQLISQFEGIERENDDYKVTYYIALANESSVK